jgi:hypothetical protein
VIRRVRCECGANLYFLEIDAEGKNESVLRCCNCHKTTPASASLSDATQNLNGLHNPEELAKQPTGTVKTA